MGLAQAAMSIGGAGVVLCVLYIVILCVTAVYIKNAASRSDSASMYYVIPEWFGPFKDNGRKWIGNPTVFTTAGGFVPATYTKTLSNSILKDVTSNTECILQCAGDVTCSGFMFDNVANTCTFYKSVGVLFPSSTSNVMFSVSGKEPSLFDLHTGKMPPAWPSLPVTTGLTVGSGDVGITTLVCADGKCTVTTSEPHGLVATSTATLYNYGTITLFPGSSGIPFTLSASQITIVSPSTFSFDSPYVGTISTPGIRMSKSLKADSVLFMTNTVHGFTEGATIEVTGAVPPLFNNTYTVTSIPSTKAFTVDIAGSDVGQNGTGGSVVQTSSMAPFVGTDAFSCATACSSNSECSAFLFDSSGKSCTQLSAVNTEPMVTSTKDTYTIIDKTFDEVDQYW